MDDANKSKDCHCNHPKPPPPVEVPEGVLRASVDSEKHSLTIDYDPAILSDETIREVASRLVPEGEGHLEKCLMRLHGRACEACAIRFEHKAEAIPGVRRATATFIGGVMTVTYNDALLTPEEVFAKVNATGAKVSPMTDSEAESWMRTDRVEAAFTGLCLLFTVAGWYAGWGTTLSNVCYLLAYLTGGTFGVLASIQSLRQWTIDVDLLMVLAALGAAYVGAPLEGATLLFLFSFSNVLQEYAIDRTRRAIHSLMKLRPEKALTRRNGETVLLPSKAPAPSTRHPSRANRCRFTKKRATSSSRAPSTRAAVWRFASRSWRRTPPSKNSSTWWRKRRARKPRPSGFSTAPSNGMPAGSSPLRSR